MLLTRVAAAAGRCSEVVVVVIVDVNAGAESAPHDMTISFETVDPAITVAALKAKKVSEPNVDAEKAGKRAVNRIPENCKRLEPLDQFELL